MALLGLIVGKGARTLARWASGMVRPPYASEQVFLVLGRLDGVCALSFLR